MTTTAMLSIIAALILASIVSGETASSVLGLGQDSSSRVEKSADLSPPEVRARMDAMLSGGQLLPYPELVATLNAAGDMPGMGFWPDLFLLARRVSTQNALECYMAAFRLRAKDSADRVVGEIREVASSEEVERLYWAVRVLGVYPETGAAGALVEAMKTAKSRGPQDSLDKNWTSRINALAGQTIFVRKVSRLHELYTQASTVNARMRIILQQPVLFDFRQCLAYGMGLEGAWSQRVLVALAKEQPDAVASWILNLSATQLEDSEWPPGVDRTREGLDGYKRKLAELLPPESAKILEMLLK